MKKLLAAVVGLSALLSIPAYAQVGGNLAATPAEPLDLAIGGASGTPTPATFSLTTGDYYRLTITSDGGAEALFSSPTLMQNIWLNQIVVDGIEIKLFGSAPAVAGVELGEQGAGSAAITFVPIRPGTYEFTIKVGANLQMGTFVVQ